MRAIALKFPLTLPITRIGAVAVMKNAPMPSDVFAGVDP
jgi:hypothetical protein